MLVNEIKERSLVTSLLSLKNQCTAHFEFERLDEFIRFYNEVINALGIYSEQKNSRFVKEKLKEFPNIRLGDYKGNAFITAIGENPILGSMLSAIIALHRLRVKKRLDDELRIVTGICDSLISVLSTPGLEQMIYQEKIN